MKKTLRRFLLVWMLIILIPIAGSARLSPELNTLFNRTLAAEWIHIVAHIFIYAVIGILAPLVLFEQRGLWQRFLSTMLLILVIALFQEIFQIMIKLRPFAWTEIFDLVIDIFAGAIGFLITLPFIRRQQKSADQ